jgi:hypothetical protein
LLALGLVAGCGESFTPDTGVTVTGKVVQGGSPINSPRTPVGYGGVEVSLIGDQARASAFCDDSGSFEIVHAGKGVPPGKYKVAIVVHGNGPTEDKLEGKMNDMNTKFEVDVPKDKLGGKHDLGTIEVNDHLK